MTAASVVIKKTSNLSVTIAHDQLLSMVLIFVSDKSTISFEQSSPFRFFNLRKSCAMLFKKYLLETSIDAVLLGNGSTDFLSQSGSLEIPF